LSIFSDHLDAVGDRRPVDLVGQQDQGVRRLDPDHWLHGTREQLPLPAAAAALLHVLSPVGAQQPT